MPQKGKKSIRGEGDLYDSPKKRYNLMLTEEIKKIMDAVAEEEGLSTSELVERTFRQATIANADKTPKTTPA